MNSVGS